MLSKTINLKTYARHFEEECCNYILRLKQRRLIKWKACPFAHENNMEAVFKSKFLKNCTDFGKPSTVYGKLIFFVDKNLFKNLQIGHREPLSF